MKVRFNNVNFSYDEESVVLKNFNLTINDGEMVAILGHNGSGKSTIAKIISFCSWLEKDSERTESLATKGLIQELEKFHRLEGFFDKNSSILYIGDNNDEQNLGRFNSHIPCSLAFYRQSRTNCRRRDIGSRSGD